VIPAAIRFRLEGVSLVCLLTAMIAVWGTAHGYGPFAKHGPVHNAILLQRFRAVLSVSGTLAAVINERTHAEYALRNLSGRPLRLLSQFQTPTAPRRVSRFFRVRLPTGCPVERITHSTSDWLMLFEPTLSIVDGAQSKCFVDRLSTPLFAASVDS
jgi:hypothetical protein